MVGDHDGRLGRDGLQPDDRLLRAPVRRDEDPAPVEWLSDKRLRLHRQGRLLRRPPRSAYGCCSPRCVRRRATGIAEAFVKTLKRDYARLAILAGAETVMRLLPAWFEDYNTIHPHSGLRMLSPESTSAGLPKPAPLPLRSNRVHSGFLGQTRSPGAAEPHRRFRAVTGRPRPCRASLGRVDGRSPNVRPGLHAQDANPPGQPLAVGRAHGVPDQGPALVHALPRTRAVRPGARRQHDSGPSARHSHGPKSRGSRPSQCCYRPTTRPCGKPVSWRWAGRSSTRPW